MNPTFTHVEDYIEFIAGYRGTSGPYNLFDYRPSPVSLARYDVRIVDSFASQTMESNSSYTDKQAELAVKIVDKYRKQLSKLDPAIYVPDELDKFRLGIRKIDRSKSIYIEDNKIVLKFPYDTKIIDLVKSQSKQAQGHMEFDYDNKVWRCGMTEYIVNLVMTVGSANEFEISEQFKELYELILATEKTDYKIELTEQDGRLYITNAPDSLNEYIDQHLGGFSDSNLLNLIDNAAILGYSVDAGLFYKLDPDITQQRLTMLLERQHHFKQDAISLTDVVDYARQLNRLPVYVYSNGLPRKDTDDIKYLSRGIDVDVTPKVLVSTTSLMIGSRKQAWLANAEKIFYIE